MGAACRMYPLHLDAGTARCWTCQPSRLYPAEPGVDATWRIDDEMRSDGLWKGRSGGFGYAARDMARQVKWEDPAMRREIERERERVHANERSEDARRVAGRAATTGRVDGEIQEELKRPSDCWYVPVCRVWGDSKEDA